MNPYRAKIVKEKDNLMAAKKTMWEGMHGQSMPQRRMKLHVPDNYSTHFDVYKKRVEFVRGMSDAKVKELVETRQLPKVLGFENNDSLSKNRKQHSILVAAGKRSFQHNDSVEVARGIYKTGSLGKTIRSREGPIVNMLHIAGIIDVKVVRSGHRKITVKDKERLKRSIDEKRIVW
jgi:hypothetical protein